MFKTLTIDQLNQHVEIAYEQMTEPIALGGLTAEEVTALTSAGLTLMMDELHERALRENYVRSTVPAPGFAPDGSPADVIFLPRTDAQLATLARIDAKIARSYAARSVAPF